MGRGGRSGRVPAGRAVLLALAAFVLVSVAFFNAGPAADLLGPSGAGLLDETWRYTSDGAAARLVAHGDAGRRLYGRFLPLDLAYAALFAGVLALAIRYAFPHGGAPALARPLPAIPLAAGCADWLENALLWRLLVAFPRRLDGPAAVAGIVTTTKLALVNASFLIAALGFLLLAARAIRGLSRRGGALGV